MATTVQQNTPTVHASEQTKTSQTITEESGKTVTTRSFYITSESTPSSPEDPEINFVRTDTKRRSLSKEAYLKLHRNTSNRKSIELLKERYEASTQGSDKSVDAVEIRHNRRSVECKSPVSPSNENRLDSTRIILNSTQKIENLQRKLSPRLSRDTVESLKFKYSPSNFGYSLDDETKREKAIIIEKPALPEKPKIIPPKPPKRISTLANFNTQTSFDFETVPAHEVVLRSSSEDSIEKLEFFMSEFTMEPKREVKEKKRTSSFRKILTGGIFSKDKKKSEKKTTDEKTKTKKTENVIVADNAQNEQTFNRKFDNQYINQVRKTASNVNGGSDHTDLPSNDTMDVEKRYAEMHVNQFNKIKATFSNPENFNKPPESYRYMHNNPSPSIDRYIDTSSSSNTLESLDRSTYQNALIAQAEMKQLKEKEVGRTKQRSVDNMETPPRAKQTYQNVQLVKPKALIPINSERALPNPYHNGQDGNEPVLKTTEKNLNTDEKDYASKTPVYNRQNDFDDVSFEYSSSKMHHHQQEQRQYSPNLTKSSTSSSTQNSPSSPSFSARSSPKSPTLEGSKLRLPSNRERVNLQPRIKSPIPQPKISTEKIIATELLKNKSEPKKIVQNHQIIDDGYEQKIYEPKPVNSMLVRQSPVPIMRVKSPETISSVDAFEAGKWHQKQRELANSPTINDSSQVVTDAMVHVDPEMKRNSLKYSSLPVAMRKHNQEAVGAIQRPVTPVKRVPSTASLQQSPQKHEIRQSVELYCWKEIQKLKEKQDQELKYQLQYTPYGYVEDPIIQRRSRSVEPTQQRNTKRSTSLPREVRSNLNPRMFYREPIPENRPIIYRENDIYAQKNPNFVRNSPQRSTVSGTMTPKSPQKYEGYYTDSGEVTYRPIFNRGSLTSQIQQENQRELQKKVSFNGNRTPVQDSQQTWPTKNGFVQSPPQRRVEKTMSVGDDEVFLRNTHIKQMNEQAQKQMLRNGQYATRDSLVSLPGHQNINEAPYGIRSSVQSNQTYASRPQEQLINEPVYITRQNKQNTTQLTRQKQENLQNIYGTRQQPEVDPLYVKQNYPTRNNQQLVPMQQDVRDNGSVSNDAIYGSKQQLALERYFPNNNLVLDSPYGTRRILTTGPITTVTKQVTVTNKFCDIYGNIQDGGKKIAISPTNPQIQQTGVIYGQLQGNVIGRPPQYQSYNQMPNQNFIRGNRLTASANDMYKRYPNDPRYRDVLSFNPNGPLPPTPNESKLQMLMSRKNNVNRAHPQMSDTESDTSEVKRIMNRNYMGGNGGKGSNQRSSLIHF